MILDQFLQIGLSPHQGLDPGQSLRPADGGGALIGRTRRSPCVSVTEKYIPGLQEETGKRIKEG